MQLQFICNNISKEKRGGKCRSKVGIPIKKHTNSLGEYIAGYPTESMLTPLGWPMDG